MKYKTVQCTQLRFTEIQGMYKTFLKQIVQLPALRETATKAGETDPGPALSLHRRMHRCVVRRRGKVVWKHHGQETWMATALKQGFLFKHGIVNPDLKNLSLSLSTFYSFAKIHLISWKKQASINYLQTRTCSVKECQRFSIKTPRDPSLYFID